MKTIKIKFVDFWKEFDVNDNFILNFLKKHYNVEICEDADYIIGSIFGEPYAICAYDKIRIMFSGENYIPDLNLVDYAISPYPIDFLDRHLYRPVCFNTENDHFASLQEKKRAFDISILDEKPYFANFIASHESEYNIRGDFFKSLSNYKRVESPGSYLNNTGPSVSVSHLDESKIIFQKKCKFTLCFESTKHEGFITEKIVDAFLADSIPVYYGSSTVTTIFNPKSFINCSDFPSFDAAIEKIIELDQNDDKYIEMLNQPIFNIPDTPQRFQKNLEQFLLNIFNQPLSEAPRRSKVYSAIGHESFIKNSDLFGSNINTIANQIYKIKQKPNSKNTKSLRTLKKQLRKELKLYHLEKKSFFYSLAYPRFMYFYWLFKGIKNKFFKSK